MEEKRSLAQKYLQEKVNPILEPLLEELLVKKPSNVAAFMSEYIFRLLNNSQAVDSSDEEDPKEEELTIKQEEIRKRRNNHKKNSRQAISAQSFGEYNPPMDSAFRRIEKDKATSEAISVLVKKSILFQNLNEKDFSILVDAMAQTQTVPGQQIIVEGEKGDTLYLIAEGEYECFKLINGQSTYLKTYRPGQFFGELALMYNAPRAASIVCIVRGKLYGLDRLTFNAIVHGSAASRKNNYSQILSKVELLAEMDSYEKDLLCDALREEKFSAGSYVVRQGDHGDRFYIVAEGNLVAEKGEPKETVWKYKESDYFGEIALMKNTVRQASVKAVTDCTLVSVERDTFKRLLGPVEDILRRNMQKYQKYCPN